MIKDNRGGKRAPKTLNANNIAFPKGVNEKQKEAIREVVRQIPQYDFYNDTDYEIKDIKIDAREIEGLNKYSVGVSITTGRKNDEGTYNALLGRKRRLFFVGDNGGYKVVGKGYKNKRVSRFELLNKYWER